MILKLASHARFKQFQRCQSLLRLLTKAFDLLVEVEFASPDVQEFKYWVREARVSSVFAVELGMRFKFKFGTIHFHCQFGVTAWIAEATSNDNFLQQNVEIQSIFMATYSI